jgi:hypothetical protein
MQPYEGPRQYCQRLEPQQRQVLPLRQRHCAPARGVHAPHWQLLLQTCQPHESQPDSVVPGLQTPWPPQVPHAPQAFHWQVELLQLRERLWLPQFPQPCDCVCVCPGEQTAAVWQADHAPQAFQSHVPELQVRDRVRVPSPHEPHASVCVSDCPGEHVAAVSHGAQSPHACHSHEPPSQVRVR